MMNTEEIHPLLQGLESVEWNATHWLIINPRAEEIFDTLPQYEICVLYDDNESIIQSKEELKQALSENYELGITHLEIFLS